MSSWEDELDVDLSDIWAAGNKPEQKPGGGGGAEEDGGDDLAFPTQAAVPQVSQREVRVSGLQPENGVANAEVADAATQVASLLEEPSRGRSTVTVATHRLPSFQHREGSTAPIATQRLASDGPTQRPGSSQALGLRNPNPREKGGQQAGVDIRRYFTQGGSSSGADGGGARKRPRIPGPVGDFFQKDQRDEGDAVEGDGRALGAREDDFNDRVFRKGAWVSALRSLNVEEFDPARYAILKVTASSIRSSPMYQHIPHFVAVIKELTPNVFGDAAVLLKDPTGTVAGMMNNKVFSNTDYARAISPGAAIVLRQVAIFSPSAHYLNITDNNVVQVFAANTDLPQGSTPKPQQKQEPPSPPKQLPQPGSQPQPAPQLQPSPPQQEQPPPQPRPQIPSQPSQPQPLHQRLQPPQPQSQPRPPPSPPQEPSKAPDSIPAAASWDLITPSPSPPQEPPPPPEPQAPEGIAEAAKMAGWGDLTDDMEALLNEDVDDFYK